LKGLRGGGSPFLKEVQKSRRGARTIPWESEKGRRLEVLTNPGEMAGGKENFAPSESGGATSRNKVWEPEKRLKGRTKTRKLGRVGNLSFGIKKVDLQIF